MQKKSDKYVLITAARNEQDYIERTILSVIEQKKLPEKWIIVSDGSTDKTDEIVYKYKADHAFIELIQVDSASKRHFGSKVNALNYAINQINISGIDYNFIGILDADVSFDNNYYEFVLNQFKHNPQLGVAGGNLHNRDGNDFREITTAKNSVPGPIQVFRRECFEMIGGKILPLKEGGEDAAAEIMARMHNWKVQHFPELKVLHWRPFNAANMNFFQSFINLGIRDYMLGYHPLFEISRCIMRFTEKPFLIASFIHFVGYVWGVLTKRKRLVSDRFVQYIRSEQMGRLKALITLKQAN